MTAPRVVVPAASAALGLGLALAGCFRDPDPFTVDADDVAVHVILEAGADTVLAIVEKPGNPIEDAVVRLITGEDTVTFAFSPEPCVEDFFAGGQQAGCHRAALVEPIRAGTTYALEVELPGGERITGATTVPMPLTLTSPTASQTVVADCGDPVACYAEFIEQPPYIVPVARVVFRWAEAADRDRLHGIVRSTRTFLDGVEYGPGREGCDLGFEPFRGQATADSLVIAIPGIFCPPEPLRDARFDSIHARARVYVWNQAVEAYMDALAEAGGSSRADYLAVGIEGAWGVFGAVAPTERAITILRDPAPAP